MAPAGGPLGEVLELAEAVGVGDELRAIATRATDIGLHLRPDRYSLMVSPPRDKRVMLFTVWPQSLDGGSFRIWRSAKAFADYIPGVTEDAARAALGVDNEGTLLRAEVDGFLDGLSQLLANSDHAVAASEWSWDRYADELQITTERLAVARSLVDALEGAAAAHGLPWRAVFRKGYVGLRRSGGYNVAVVDCYYYRATTKFAVKLPADPATLHLENPYPARKATWYPAYKEWAWFVPTLADMPDVTLAFELALPFHLPGGWTLDPPATTPHRRNRPHPPNRVRSLLAPGDGGRRRHRAPSPEQAAHGMPHASMTVGHSLGVPPSPFDRR